LDILWNFCGWLIEEAHFWGAMTTGAIATLMVRFLVAAALRHVGPPLLGWMPAGILGSICSFL
jgi:hypothetical protein